MFGKKAPPPQEQAKEWKKNIKAQRRQIERQSHKIETEEERLKLKVKTLIKQGHQDAALPIVGELVNSRKARSKMLKTCYQLDSLIRQIDLQIAQVKVCGAFKQSTEVTHMLNQMIKLPEMQHTMMQLQQEMEKSGLAGEMIDEAMEQDEEDPEDAEVAAKLIYNQIAQEVNKTSAKPVPLIPVSQEEIEEDPKAAALAG